MAIKLRPLHTQLNSTASWVTKFCSCGRAACKSGFNDDKVLPIGAVESQADMVPLIDGFDSEI